MTSTTEGYVRAPAPQSSPYLTVAPDGPSSFVRLVPPAQLREITDAVMVRASYMDSPLVLATIPEALAGERDDARFAQMAAQGATVVLLGRNLDRYVSSTGREPHRVPLRADDPLWTEWNLIVCSASARTAFVARALDPSSALAPDCPYGWVTERDPEAVGALARVVLERTPHLRLRVPTYSGPHAGAGAA